MIALELLAPAKDLTCGIAAVDHGADAVYIGAQRFGARAAAGNSVEDIQHLCEYAHLFGVKVYVTVNTILYDDELEPTRLLIHQLYEAGVDAILVQDMAILQMDLPPIALHASTQTDNRTASKVKWLQHQGFQRVVLARELSVDEISEIHREVPDMPLEVFVHGALCVSYSGLCYASQYCFGRSANRGAGRLKDANYVKNVVSAYSQRLDAIIAQYPCQYQRASRGRCTYTFTPHLEKTFNRGFTTYFLQGRQPDIFSPDTPKAMGEYVGHVKEMRRDSFTVAGTASFSNGDGLCFINNVRALEGFRVNRAEGNRLFPQQMPSGLHSGMALYRNNDQEMERQLSRKSSERKIPLQLHLQTTSDGFSLSAEGVEVTIVCEHQQAEKPQRDNILRQLSKLGATPYECSGVEMAPDFNYFIPSSMLSELRRQLTDALMQSARCRFEGSEMPSRQSRDAVSLPESYRFPYLYNISNRLAAAFYGTRDVSAYELKGGKGPIMQCRHCLRYALGACVKHGGRKPQFTEPLFLRLGDGRRFRLEFDCSHCQMNVYAAD